MSNSTTIKCVKCRKRITEEQRNACPACPKCKYRGPNAITKVEVVMIYAHQRPWYVKFWHRYIW